MGFDVSYHPINEDEIHEWYFSKLADIKIGDEESARELALRHGIKDLYIDKYLNVLRLGAGTDADEIFDKTHGMYIAVAQGFFRTFFYLRNAAFTSVVEQNEIYRRYTKPWQDILRIPLDNPIKNQIFENYCSGVYLSYTQLKQLMEDYENLPDIQNILNENYSFNRIDVFMKAVRFAIDNNLGILEATEVIEPNPLDINKSFCRSNLFSCDTDGALLYQEAAIKQLSQVLPKDRSPSPEKKSLFSKLFGKK